MSAFDPLSFFFIVIVGGLSFRAVARSNQMMAMDYSNRPLLLTKNKSIPLLITCGFLITLSSTALIGFYRTGTLGILFAFVYVFFGSMLLDVMINKFFKRIQYLFVFNPIIHLFILPYIFFLGTLGFVLTK